MSVYIVDTECTDLNEPEVIELAWFKARPVSDLAGDSDMIPRPLSADAFEKFEQRYQSQKPSSFGALNVHHILPHELEGCPPSAEARLPADCQFMIAHNADHDWRCLGSPASVKRIDTACMARWLWQDADSYAQGSLLYMLLGPKPSTRQLLKDAHSALTDVENNALLLEQILDAKPEIVTWSELYEYSEACRIPLKMPIGEKQGVKGLTLDEAVDADLSFVMWCLRQDWIDDYLRIGLEQAIERYNNPPPPEPDTRQICELDPNCMLVAGHKGDCDHIPF